MSGRWRVETWDPAYGSATEDEANGGPGPVAVELDVECPAARWRPLDPAPGPPWAEVLFVDGVRRVDAMGWLSGAPGEDPGGPVLGLFASYAAGLVRCRPGEARLVAAEVRRGVFTAARPAAVATRAGHYPPEPVTVRDGGPTPAQQLGQAVQQRMRALEAEASRAHRHPAGDDLLVVDGPLHDRTELPRTLGYVKTHTRSYLPPELHALAGGLRPGQRTPLFALPGRRPRLSWYLKLPEPSGAPWAGVVRVECSAAAGPVPAVAALAGRSAPVLGRHASVEFKDARAPQNLVPVAGLERELRRRLGDQALLHRAIRRATA